MAEMNMILGDIRLPIREATISGYMLDPDWLREYGGNERPRLEWEVVVQTEERAIHEETDDETILDPRMSWGEFSFPAMRRWLDLEGKIISYDATGDGARGVVRAFSYFATHEAMAESTLHFGERAGNKFVIRWQGTCDPLLEEPYHKNVPFLIQTEAVLQEITVHAAPSDTDATTLERLSKHIDPADLIQRPMKEVVHNVPVKKRFGIFDPLLGRIFRRPGAGRSIHRYSVFEPRV
jgi:hypothetical protein